MSELLDYFNTTYSPYTKAAVTVFLSIVAAGILDIFVSRLAKRFAGFTKTEIDDKLVALLHKPLFLTVLLIGIVLSISYLELSEKIVFYSHGIIYSIIVIIWFFTLIRISNLFIEHAIQKRADATGLQNNMIPFIENISKIILIVAVLMALLSLWKVNITPLVASAGIAGVAVAFAAKDTIANFFGGISLFLDKPFTIGDYVVLDQGERGEVVAIGIRSTRIKTRDDIVITIPNSIIANTKIINESAPVPKFRVRIPASVAYGSDIDLVEKILLEVVSGNSNIADDPEPRVRFRTFGDSALNFELLCWVKEPSLRGKTIHELNSHIYKKFNETGIKIPFPQRDVHIYKEQS